MNPTNQTFEASMQRLEQIVRSMEKGDVELEESLRLFQDKHRTKPFSTRQKAVAHCLIQIFLGFSIKLAEIVG